MKNPTEESEGLPEGSEGVPEWSAGLPEGSEGLPVGLKACLRGLRAYQEALRGGADGGAEGRLFSLCLPFSLPVNPKGSTVGALSSSTYAPPPMSVSLLSHFSFSLRPISF